MNLPTAGDTWRPSVPASAPVESGTSWKLCRRTRSLPATYTQRFRGRRLTVSEPWSGHTLGLLWFRGTLRPWFFLHTLRVQALVVAPTYPDPRNGSQGLLLLLLFLLLMAGFRGAQLPVQACHTPALGPVRTPSSPDLGVLICRWPHTFLTPGVCTEQVALWGSHLTRMSGAHWLSLSLLHGTGGPWDLTEGQMLLKVPNRGGGEESPPLAHV